MLDFTPNPIAIQLGPIPVYWYGIGYALGLAAAYLVMVWLARRAGEDPDLLGNGIIIVAIAALIGGRLYHVIDQWALYKDDLIKIFLPPYSGLGVYGGIVFGTVAGVPVRPLQEGPVPALGRHRGARAVHDAGHRALGQLLQPGAVRAADDAAVGDPDRLRPSHRGVRSVRRVRSRRHTRPVLPPALPVRIDLRGRSASSSSSGSGSICASGCGRATCCSSSSSGTGSCGSLLETLRVDNWTFFGVPIAQIVSVLIVVPALLILLWRHRPGHPLDEPPSRPRGATWGAIGRPVTADEEAALDRQEELDEDDEDYDDEDEYDDDVVDDADEDDETDEDGDEPEDDDDEDDDDAQATERLTTMRP